MSTFLYILLAIFVFGVLIFVHELGHFLAARIFKVRVLEFAIGMGPAIFKRQGKRTLYSVRALPIGGFCAMDGEDGEAAEKPMMTNAPELGETDAPFYEKPLWQKIIILVAGAAMNFLIGLVVLLCLSARGDALVTTEIDYFMDGFPYQGEEMLMPGDKIEKINGYFIFTNADISTFLEHDKGEPYEIEVTRAGERLTVTVPLERRTYEYKTLDENGNETTAQGSMYGLVFKSEPATIGGRLKNAWLNAIDFVRIVKVSLFDLFGGRASVSELSGPIGIGTMITQTAQQSMPTMWMLVAMIAVNLAVMNLLPLPALDGGRILFLIVGKIVFMIRKKPLNPRYETAINFAGLALLMILMVYVSFNDIMRLVK